VHSLVEYIELNNGGVLDIVRAFVRARQLVALVSHPVAVPIATAGEQRGLQLPRQALRA
jgi:hypothetical protein